MPGVTLTAADIAQAQALGIDVKGMMLTAGAKCDDLKQMLGVLINDVLTPAGDTTWWRLEDEQATNELERFSRVARRKASALCTAKEATHVLPVGLTH